MGAYFSGSFINRLNNIKDSNGIVYFYQPQADNQYSVALPSPSGSEKYFHSVVVLPEEFFQNVNTINLQQQQQQDQIAAICGQLSIALPSASNNNNQYGIEKGTTAMYEYRRSITQSCQVEQAPFITSVRGARTIRNPSKPYYSNESNTNINVTSGTLYLK